MIGSEEIFDKIIKNFSPGKIWQLDHIKDIPAKQGDFINVISLVDDLTHQGYGVCLPEEFFLDLNARTLRKYLKPLKWRRIKSKKQAIEEEITPFILMNEARQRINSNVYYGGTGWRGISIPENKEFLFYSWIEGWELALLGRNLFKIRRYDNPEALEQLEDIIEKAHISEEISKITKRRINLKEEIMRKGGIRTGTTPSRTKKEFFYEDMRIDGLPVNFKKGRSDIFPAAWFNSTFHYHNCKDKINFIDYVCPKTEVICAHDIAFATVNFLNDFDYHPESYMVFPIFPKPANQWFDANTIYRKMVFKKVKGRRMPINKIDREGLLWSHAKATKAKFF